MKNTMPWSVYAMGQAVSKFFANFKKLYLFVFVAIFFC